MSERKNKKTASAQSPMVDAAQALHALAWALVYADPSVCMTMREKFRQRFDDDSIIDKLAQWAQTITKELAKIPEGLSAAMYGGGMPVSVKYRETLGEMHGPWFQFAAVPGWGYRGSTPTSPAVAGALLEAIDKMITAFEKTEEPAGRSAS